MLLNWVTETQPWEEKRFVVWVLAFLLIQMQLCIHSSCSIELNTWFKVQSIRLRKSLQRSMGSHLSAFILNQLSSCLFFLFSIEFVLLISPGLLFLISFSCLKICFITRYLSLSSWISSPQITLFWFVRVLSFSLLPRLLCSFFTRSMSFYQPLLLFIPPFTRKDKKWNQQLLSVTLIFMHSSLLFHFTLQTSHLSHIIFLTWILIEKLNMRTAALVPPKPPLTISCLWVSPINSNCKTHSADTKPLGLTFSAG